MNRKVMWVSLDNKVFEHVKLMSKEDSLLADGIIIHLDIERSSRHQYNILCDSQWQVQKVELQNLDRPEQALVLHSDGKGKWTNTKGGVIPSLDSCRDVDIYYSSFTNTLAIRRLTLKLNDSAEIKAVFINPLDMSVSAARQQYTFLRKTSNGALYRYESLDSGFTAELPVDSDGLVIEYPKFFRRVWAR
jgi:hypothetical protein